jgi:hypothetical protein
MDAVKHCCVVPARPLKPAVAVGYPMFVDAHPPPVKFKAKRVARCQMGVAMIYSVDFVRRRIHVAVEASRISVVAPRQPVRQREKPAERWPMDVEGN